MTPEAHTRHTLIDPALTNKGWADTHIIREYVIADGQVMPKNGKYTRKNALKADYLLTLNGTTPLAIIEAKSTQKSLRHGLEQAKHYGNLTQTPFVYACNGSGFIEYDFITGQARELSMNEFPTPNELWERYVFESNLTPDELKILQTPYHYKQGDKTPRYYQRIAIDRTVQAVAKGQNRILLVMATGTGKTYTAFQIIYRLKQAKLKNRILFLADRNVLIDQTIGKDFKPFEKIITKIGDKHLDSAYEIYMSLYHQLAGDDNAEPFRQFDPDFFDLIIIDECHRGSAKEESAWRKILDYFSKATHIGLTATPKENKEVSNISYFGEPIYTYSLKQGILDGFLAPYEVIRLMTDKDTWQPEDGQQDRDGNLIDQRIYNNKDYDRTLILSEREKTVAKKISDYLKATDRFAKTIVFCVDIDHAERMAIALANENADLMAQDHRYVMKITGDDAIGKKQLSNFIDPSSKYPTIATTSKLLTTGVDCTTCRLIVLDSNIGSMTEFKQIIGRGTRLNPNFDKFSFTIMDFRGATRLFEDPDFDGEPVVVYEPVDGNPVPPTPPTPPEPPPTPKNKPIVDGVAVEITKEIVKIYRDGQLTTESLKDYSQKNVLGQYATLDNFLRAWFASDKKQAIVDELTERGVFFDELRQAVGRDDLDEFDLIAHIAYNRPPLSRSQRAGKIKPDYFAKYGETCQAIIGVLLEKYKNDGLLCLEQTEILKTADFLSFGSPVQIVKAFGGKEAYFMAIKELQNQLYSE